MIKRKSGGNNPADFPGEAAAALVSEAHFMRTCKMSGITGSRID